MNRFHQPHSRRSQPEAYATIFVGASRYLLGRIQTVHGNDECACQRTVLVRQADRKILTGADCVGILFRYELEREAEPSVALRLDRRSRKHQAFRTA